MTFEHKPGPLGLTTQDTSLASRTWQYAAVLPGRVTIYRQLKWRSVGQEVLGQARRTVINEVTCHSGTDDRRFSDLGWPQGAARQKRPAPAARRKHRGGERQRSPNVADPGEGRACNRLRL